MKGHWDIVYVENARKGITPVCLDFQLLYLKSIKNSKPEIWEELKNLIKKVEG